MNKNIGAVAAHFENKDEAVRRIYDELLKKVKRFGPVAEDPKKTSIHLVNNTAFAGVATRKTSINLTIKGDIRLSSPRIHRTEQASARRFHHEVKLTSPAEIDAELVSWLKNAYSISG